ncbi:MAG: hypothetical protein ACYCQJ_02655 [Nitrososphaerales archaeon]
MVDKAEVKIYAVGSRHSVNLPSDLVRDSQFPFEAGEKLIIRIDKDRLIIERASPKK